MYWRSGSRISLRFAHSPRRARAATSNSRPTVSCCRPRNGHVSLAGRRILTTGATARYRRAAGLPPDHAPRWEQLDLAFVRQHGRYADVTSILNGAARLRAGDLYMAFADNLYPHGNPMLALHASPAGDTVLARPYDLSLIHI